MENVLTTYQLKKRYGKHMAVNGVDMHINRGDIYGFVGENGSGKTTIPSSRKIRQARNS